MEYNKDYMKTSYYVEHDDFFKYIREYLQEEKTNLYINSYYYTDTEDSYINDSETSDTETSDTETSDTDSNSIG